MSETQQQTIFGDPIEEQIFIETTGRVIRPFRRLIDQAVSEYRLMVQSDGIRVEAVDPANVGAVFATLHADAFETYDVAESVIGISSDGFGSALQHARYGKSTDDPISIRADQMHLQTEVERELGGSDVEISERVPLLDPDAIRQSPDLPDLDLSVAAEPPPETFIEAVGAMDTSNHIRIGSNLDSIVFNQDTGSHQRNIEIDATPTETSEWTHFSGDYMEMIATGLRNGYVDSLTLRWDEEYPIFAEFEREGVLSGQYMIAHRIKD